MSSSVSLNGSFFKAPKVGFLLLLLGRLLNDHVLAGVFVARWRWRRGRFPVSGSRWLFLDSIDRIGLIDENSSRGWRGLDVDSLGGLTGVALLQRDVVRLGRGFLLGWLRQKLSEVETERRCVLSLFSWWLVLEGGSDRLRRLERLLGFRPGTDVDLRPGLDVLGRSKVLFQLLRGLEVGLVLVLLDRAKVSWRLSILLLRSLLFGLRSQVLRSWVRSLRAGVRSLLILLLLGSWR